MSELHPLLKIDFGLIPIERYRGCLVTKIIGGFSVFDQSSTTPEGIDLIIDEAGSLLNESIVTIKNNNSGEMECTNDENLNK